MAKLTLTNACCGKSLRRLGCGGPLVLTQTNDEPCCCATKICWTRGRGILFSDSVDDLSVDESSDITVCKVIVDYFPVQCGAYPYFNPQKIAEFLNNGGVYFTNCEWTNCQPSGTPGVCDPDGAAFNAHMNAIGAGLSRGGGTISTNPQYNPLGSNLFSGCVVNGNATAGINGGTPLLSVQPGSYCGSEPGGICCAGAKVGRGAAIGFGDSNINISINIRDNLLRHSAANLF